MSISADQNLSVDPKNGFPVVFAAAGVQGGVAPIQYNWDFGEPASGVQNGASVAQATHNFAIPGVYNVKLTLTDARAQTFQTSKAVTVIDPTTNPNPNPSPNLPPVASGVVSPSTATAGQTLTFDASTASAGTANQQIVSYSWKFQDGQVLNGKVVSRTFSAVSSYSVELTVTDNTGLSARTSMNFVIQAAAPTPCPVPSAGSLGAPVSGVGNTLAAGSGHSLVLKSDGTFWASGLAANGQLGAGSMQNCSQFIQVLSGVKSVAAGGLHSLALKADGSLWATGDNSYGQLGTGDKTSHSKFFQVMTGVKEIAAGRFQSFAIKDDNSLWAVGENGVGQLGAGNTVDQYQFVKVLADVKAVSSGGLHTLVLKMNGSLWAAGWNGFYQLGTGDTADQHQFVQILGSGVQAIAAGYLHSLVVKTDGSLWVVGANGNGVSGGGAATYGQLGVQALLSDQNTICTSAYCKQLFQVMSGVKAVSAGYGHSLALKADGSLWAAGFNEFGQLGNGSNNNQGQFMQVATGVQGMAAGYLHTLAAKTDGSLYTVGANSNGIDCGVVHCDANSGAPRVVYGQLGTGDTMDHSTFVRVMAAIAIAGQ
ncbi:PKD domain-containing protein [Chitinivorax sp. PXF-14]|uniref:RCC1 domain-containing protein n=1 Tax=Chitinivorax sp. PXF-14 TaxID=3230488 RepID=UPI003465EC52